MGFGLSVFIACRVFPNCDNTNFDYQAIMVGIVAAIFTLLIGWNIFQVIDWKSERKIIEDLRKELESNLNYIHNRCDYNQAVVYAMMSQTASSFFAPNGKEAIKYQMLLKGIQSLKILSKIPETEVETNAIMETLIKGLQNSNDVKLNENIITEILISCGEIKDRQNIKNFEEFKKLLENQ